MYRSALCAAVCLYVFAVGHIAEAKKPPIPSIAGTIWGIGGVRTYSARVIGTPDQFIQSYEVYFDPSGYFSCYDFRFKATWQGVWLQKNGKIGLEFFTAEISRGLAEEYSEMFEQRVDVATKVWRIKGSLKWAKDGLLEMKFAEAFKSASTYPTKKIKLNWKCKGTALQKEDIPKRLGH